MPAQFRRLAAPGVVLVLALIVSVPAALAAFPGKNGRIAFQRDPGNSDIYTVLPDGSAMTQLTTASGFDAEPVWSPDGTKIVFYGAGVGGTTDIFVMSANGSGLTNVTNSSGEYETEPSWSHDGAKILYTESFPSGDIFVMDADGTDRTNLTNDAAFDSKAMWSPLGNRIVYMTNTDYPFGDFDIVTMNPDGTGRTTPAGGPENDIHPDWSPDGTKIVFARDLVVSANNHDVWSMNANGTGQTQLTSTPGIDFAPAFSPDGTKIVFQGSGGNPGDLFTMNVNGSGRTNVTNDSTSDANPDWQPLLSGPYVRPKGATPFKVSLVPAYNQCTVPNRQHGPPLAFPACTPPTFASNSVTVGTMDANGAEANAEGSFRFKVVVGAPGPPEDSNVLVQASITDVRCAGSTSTCGNVNAADGRDYVGALQASSTIRVTDRWNAVAPGGGKEGATIVDVPFPFPFTCSNTADAGVGATCTSNTSVHAIVPLAIRDRKRAVWQLGAVNVDDGGPDGVTGTIPNTRFMTQGLFVP